MEAVRAGARGYVLKDAPALEVIAAIEALSAGGTFYTASLIPAVVHGSDAPLLTERERQVLANIVEGGSNKQIASARLSVRTVETHRQNIRRKLGAVSAADLVRRALKMGLMKI